VIVGDQHTFKYTVIHQGREVRVHCSQSTESSLKPEPPIPTGLWPGLSKWA
jgi:hypothetical protein